MSALLRAWARLWGGVILPAPVAPPLAPQPAPAPAAAIPVLTPAEGAALAVPPVPAAPPPAPPPIVQPSPAYVPPVILPDASAGALWTGGVPLAAVLLSEAFEGYKAQPYDDGFGFWTIGIGSRTDPTGKAVTPRTLAVTHATAVTMAQRDLVKAAGLVKKAVRVPVTERQAATLILLANNLGDLTVAAKSLLALVNAGRWRDAANLLGIYRNSAGKPVLGLRRRRWAEAAFSLGMEPVPAKEKAWATIHTVDGWPALP